MFEENSEDDAPVPVWPAFGDLMACLFGLFVLFFVWAVAVQTTLEHDLTTEREAHKAKEKRLQTLEEAFASEIAKGRITIVNGHIGIGQNVLFASASATLTAEGEALIKDLSPIFKTYASSHPELLMVSGFTDDHPLHGNSEFRDNWELSTARALVVTRALEANGVPRAALVVAGFGENHALAPNDTAEHRAMNRRVEIAPVPKIEPIAPTASASAAPSEAP